MSNSNDNRSFNEYLSMTEETEILTLEILEELENSPTLKDQNIQTVASLTQGELASFVANILPDRKRSANKIARELIRLFSQDGIKAQQQPVPNNFTPEVVVKFPESPETMSLSELLDAALSSVDKATEYLPYIESKPQIKAAKEKSNRPLVLVNGKLDVQASLDRILHLGQPYTREQRPDRGAGQKFVTLKQGLGQERPVYIHPLDGKPITGRDEAGYDYSKLDPDIAKSIIWARLTNHPLLPADLNKATVGANLFADKLVAPFNLILQDYWNAVDAKEIAATNVQFEVAEDSVKEKGLVDELLLEVTKVIAEIPGNNWERKVKENARDRGKKSGVNKSISGIFDSIEISGVNIDLKRLVVLSEAKISGTNVNGTIIVPNLLVNINDSGVNNNFQVIKKSWQEIAQLYDL